MTIEFFDDDAEHDALPDTRTRAARLLARLATAVLVLGTLAYWQQTGARMAVEHPEAMNVMGEPAVAGAWLAFGQVLGNLMEALLYYAWWRALGLRLSWVALAAGIVLASSFEATAWQAALAARAAGDDAWRPWLAILAGPRALWDDAAGVGGLGVAFGGAGLLALLRVGSTAETQARAGAPRSRAYALTFAAWLVFRLVAGFSLDLLRGYSPLGG